MVGRLPAPFVPASRRPVVLALVLLVVIAPRIFLQAAVERAVLNTLNHQ